MLPSRRHLFQESSCLCQQDNEVATYRLTTVWFHSKRVQALDWPSFSPDLFPIGDVWNIVMGKTPQKKPQTVEQLNIYINPKWERIPLSVTQLVTQFLSFQNMLHASNSPFVYINVSKCIFAFYKISQLFF